MTRDKFDAAFKGVSEVAKKVYGALSDTKYMSAGRAVNELFALGVRVDKNIAEGCINSLIKAGLVEESSPGLYIRTRIKEAPKKPVIKKEIEVKPAQATAKNESPVDKLLNVSIRISDASAMLKSIAAEIAVVAESVDQHMKEGSEEAKKLYALRDLLKAI